MADVLVEQGIDLGAILCWSVLETQQYADFIQVHVQRPAMANEGQSLRVRLVVDTVVASAAPGLWQQSLPFVVANRLDLCASGLS